MPIDEEEDLREHLALLEDSDPGTRAIQLVVAVASPSNDPRVLPVLERLLADRAGCIVGREPMHVAEIRWLAAWALAIERGAQGIADHVRVLGVVPPLNLGEIAHAEEQAGLERRGGNAALLASFDRLNELDRLSRADVDLDPLDFEGVRRVFIAERA